MDNPLTLPFEVFWAWVTAHPNCIIRAGTPDTVLYDDDDLHWHFATEGSGNLVVQVLRGKRFIGELLVAPEQVTYVQGTTGERDGEFAFELIAETERDRVALYFFVLAHGYETEDDKDSQFSQARVH